MGEKGFNDLIILKLQLAPLGENEVADGTVVTFTDDHYGEEMPIKDFALTLPVSEWRALGNPKELYFTASTQQLGVSRENWVILPRSLAPLVKKRGVVNGHVMDVWVEESSKPAGLTPIETPEVKVVEEDDGA